MATVAKKLTGTYELDRTHSTVQFAVKHVGVSTFRVLRRRGRPPHRRGRCNRARRARRRRVGLDRRAGRVPEHVVRGADFFDADTFPEITFRSRSVELGDGGAATVVGRLTIRGRAVGDGPRDVEPPREDPFGNAARVSTSGHNRSPRLADGLAGAAPRRQRRVGWEVEITAQLELIRTS